MEREQATKFIYDLLRALVAKKGSDLFISADFPPAPNGKHVLWKGAGCRKCHQSGYRGRSGIFELMVTADSIRDLCVQRLSASAIRNQALKEGIHVFFRRRIYIETEVCRMFANTVEALGAPRESGWFATLTASRPSVP